MYMFRHIGSPVEHCMDIAYCLCTYKKIIEGYCNALAIVEQSMFEPKWNPAFSFSIYCISKCIPTCARESLCDWLQGHLSYGASRSQDVWGSHPGLLTGEPPAGLPLLPHYQQPATSTNWHYCLVSHSIIHLNPPSDKMSLIYPLV